VFEEDRRCGEDPSSHKKVYSHHPQISTFSLFQFGAEGKKEEDGVPQTILKYFDIKRRKKGQ